MPVGHTKHDGDSMCSALVTSQAQQGRSTSLLFRYNFIDISVALGIALLINVAVIVVASETFHAHGIIVLTLQVFRVQGLGFRLVPSTATLTAPAVRH